MDSWIYPAALRLYSLGYTDQLFLGLRPWTRSNLRRLLEDTASHLDDIELSENAGEARNLYSALDRYLQGDAEDACKRRGANLRVESIYTISRVISGTPLHDSFHLGSTIVNDYDRPYENGVNNYTGASGYASMGRFLLYARGEFQRSPSADGYSQALTDTLAAVDAASYPVAINPDTGSPYLQATIPTGPIDAISRARVLEAYVSAQAFHHVISFGKQDAWYGPGLGAGMAYSNNAENFYSFRIDRTEPLYIPFLSKLTGPFRYDFFVGPLKGHIYPKNPWFHSEKISFRPTENLEFGFQRSVIWGGEGHTPITLQSFLRSFFSTVAPDSKSAYNDPTDPGARFASFDFSYRLPHLRNTLTLYADSEVHDDVSTIDNPPMASWRPGVYLSHLPGLPKLDFRIEAAYTDPPGRPSYGGRLMYWEGIQQQGYTNNGQIMGDWIGREGKGGQAWLTYHISGDEWLQCSVRTHKAATDFIPGGTTLNDFNVDVVKRIHKNIEFNGHFTYEQWKAPVYMAGRQTVTNTTLGLTWWLP